LLQLIEGIVLICYCIAVAISLRQEIAGQVIGIGLDKL
jgi:hypothetical protein